MVLFTVTFMYMCLYSLSLTHTNACAYEFLQSPLVTMCDLLFYMQLNVSVCNLISHVCDVE